MTKHESTGIEQIEQLYRSVVSRHNASPNNFFIPPKWDFSAEKVNLLCGDEITAFVSVDTSQSAKPRIQQVAFHGTGCAIMKSSASILAQISKNTPPEDAFSFMRQITEFLTSRNQSSQVPSQEFADYLADFQAFAAIRHTPARIKCALLPLQALETALLRMQTNANK